MAIDLTKVGVATTGLVSRAPLGTTAPTSQSSALNASFVDLGAIGEDGVTQGIPASGDATPLKIWQNGATARIVRSAPDDLPTFQFVMVETKATTLETYYNATVTQTATEGSLVYDSLALRLHYSWVFDYVDGSELERIYVPDGIVTETGERVWVNADTVAYDVTVEAQRVPGIAGNFRLWTTRAKS